MARKIRKSKMVLITVHVPEEILREMNELVLHGRYPSRAEFIRIAILNQIRIEKGFRTLREVDYYVH